MAEATVVAVVCDFCGEPTGGLTITFKDADGGSRQLDVCPRHMEELVSKSHTPKRGRRSGVTARTVSE